MTIGRDGAAAGAGRRPDRPRAAVVGAGVAGLTAAYLLQRAYDVTLYEADDRLGGHAHTHDIVGSGGRSLALDTGFLVHNTRTYPNLIRLLRELGVATRETEMSMSVSCTGCGLEYAGSRGSGLLRLPVPAARRPVPDAAARARRGTGAERDARHRRPAPAGGHRHRHPARLHPWRLICCALRYPWVTAQVSTLIRWQGIRLAARRLPVFPRPAHRSQEGVQ